MQSLQTSVRRQAEIRSRKVSVEFDSVCQAARAACAAMPIPNNATVIKTANEYAEELRRASPETLLAAVPSFIRQAALRVIEEQQKDPYGWRELVARWREHYEAMVQGRMPPEIQMPAIQAQAYLNGIEMAVQGQPLPLEPPVQSAELSQSTTTLGSDSRTEAWSAFCRRALELYRLRVSPARYKLAESKLPEVTVQGCAEHHIQEGLRNWSTKRLNEVQPRTVKGQLDCMVSALRCVTPKLLTPEIKELKGVMQPRADDRESMPVQVMREAVLAFKNQPVSDRVRTDYAGGASQFDAIAIEVLAVLGLRPRELIQATTNALVTKEDVFGKQGQYFRISNGKNKASERDIPLSDGAREVVKLERLREMLLWQEVNKRAPHGAVTSLGVRFKSMTKGYTLYQMRHSWKDLVVHAGVDFEVRERLLGHRVRGVAAVYGSGIPLEKGLDALMLVRRAIGL